MHELIPALSDPIRFASLNQVVKILMQYRELVEKGCLVATIRC